MYNVQFTANEMEIEVTTLFQQIAKSPKLIEAIEAWNNRDETLVNWQELKNDADKPKAIEKNKKHIEQLKTEFKNALDLEIEAENKRIATNKKHDEDIKSERNKMNRMLAEVVDAEVERLTGHMKKNTFLEGYRMSLRTKLSQQHSF